ncbi:hypothetical protein VFA_000842 [Vibrio furnissii CIP 102972]|nr:hypothetical protein VFA_000842 [Vibrio furnissii CIP 102972]
MNAIDGSKTQTFSQGFCAKKECKKTDANVFLFDLSPVE